MSARFASATEPPPPPPPPMPALELEHTIGFSGVADALHWLPAGREYAVAAGGSVLLAGEQEQRLLRGHEGPVSCLAVSRGGRWLASGERGRRADVLVWDLATRRLALRLSEHDGGVAALAFSDDERLLCSVGTAEDGPRLFVWDLRAGGIVATQGRLAAAVRAVVFGGMARDVKRRDTRAYQFATAGGGRALTLWALDAAAGELAAASVDQGALVRDYTCAQFSPDRETLVAGSSSGDVAVVAVKTRRLLRTVPACSCGVLSLATFAGGVLVGGGDGGLLLLLGRDLVDSARVQLDGAVVGLSLRLGGHGGAGPTSGDSGGGDNQTDGSDAQPYGGKHEGEILAGTAAGGVFSIRLEPGRCGGGGGGEARLRAPRLLSESHAAAVVQVAFAPGVSDRFATASRDCSLRVWDAGDYSVAARCVVADAGAPTSLQFSLDVLLSGWTDGAIRCHSADSGAPAWSIDSAHAGGVTALVLSHNQRFVVSAGAGGEVRVWDIRRRDLVSHLKEHSMAVAQLAIFRDDAHVLSCSRDRSVLCWDLRAERRVSSHIQRMGGINTVALAADERLVLTAGQEKRISFWDLRIDAPVHVIATAHDGEATCLAVAHALGVFATGGSDRLVKLWDYSSGRLIMDAVGHSACVRALAFSPDDRQLVSVGDDGGVFVWNVYTE